MGRRRDAVGDVIGGKNAPAELFRLVSNGTNEMVDYRARQGAQGRSSQVAEAFPERAKPAPKTPAPKPAPWKQLSSAHRATTLPRIYAPDTFSDLYEEDAWYEEEDPP
jgi:hypothetical protein